MYPRTEYEMTEEDLNTLLESMKPTPCIMVGGYSPRSQQENANSAWASLGKKMGFDSMSVQPISGKGTRFFTAIPSETESQRADRLARKAEEDRQTAIQTLTQQIAE